MCVCVSACVSVHVYMTKFFFTMMQYFITARKELLQVLVPRYVPVVFAFVMYVSTFFLPF